MVAAPRGLWQATEAANPQKGLGSFLATKAWYADATQPAGWEKKAARVATRVIKTRLGVGIMAAALRKENVRSQARIYYS
jgi:hypothetical protein